MADTIEFVSSEKIMDESFDQRDTSKPAEDLPPSLIPL